MKQITLILFLSLFSSKIFSQDEISIKQYYGWLRFDGNNVNKYAQHVDFGVDGKYTSEMLSTNFEYNYVGAKGFIRGVQIGYQNLTKSISDTIYFSYHNGGFGGGTSYYIKNRTFKYEFINFGPVIGQRLINKKVYIDITGGIDFGILLHDGTVTLDWPDPVTSAIETNWEMDTRAWVQISSGYNFSKLISAGISAGYIHGLSNYARSQDNDTEIYLRVINLGLALKFKI